MAEQGSTEAGMPSCDWSRKKIVLFAGSFLEVLKTRNMHQDLLLCLRTSAIPGMRRASPHLNTLGGPQSKPGGRKPSQT